MYDYDSPGRPSRRVYARALRLPPGTRGRTRNIIRFSGYLRSGPAENREQHPHQIPEKHDHSDSDRPVPAVFGAVIAVVGTSSRPNPEVRRAGLRLRAVVAAAATAGDSSCRASFSTVCGPALMKPTRK